VARCRRSICPCVARRDLVADPLGRQLALELGKGQQNVEGQPAHRGRGVELLGDRDERDRLGVEGLDQLGEVGKRAGQPVDLVDDNDVDPSGIDIPQQLLKGRAVQVAARIGGIVIMLGKGLPSLRGLTLDIGLAGIPLGIE